MTVDRRDSNAPALIFILVIAAFLIVVCFIAPQPDVLESADALEPNFTASPTPTPSPSLLGHRRGHTSSNRLVDR